MKKIGLTGGIGTGKSTVAKIIEAMGFPVFYSDDFAKNLMNDPELQSQINAILEADVFPNGLIDRQTMARLIFNDSFKREAINMLIHPMVREGFESWSKKQDTPFVFNEAAILFETGAYKRMDLNVLVIAPLELRITRVMKRDHVVREEVLQRISKQATDEEKIPLADFVVINDDEHPVLAQVEDILVKILSV